MSAEEVSEHSEVTGRKSAANLDAAPQWHRISPLAVLFFIASFFRKVAWQAAPGFIFLFAALGSTDTVKRGWILAIAAALATLLLIGGVLSYLRFRYRVSEHRIQLRKGVLHREELDIDFTRVQNITIREPWYMRPLRLAVLAIDTAGSRGREVQIAGIDRALAQDLRDTILGAARQAAQAQGSDSEGNAVVTASGDGEGQTLVRLSRRDIVIHGLTANFMLWFFIAIGAVFGSDEMAEGVIGWLEARLHLEERATALFQQGGTLLLTLAVGGVALVIMLLLPLLSVIGALLRYDGYRLAVDGETYRKSSGLLSRHDESLKRHKIQAVVWKQNFIARMFGRFSLQLRQASAGSETTQGELPSGMKSSFLVPALRPQQAGQLSAEFLPGCNMNEAVFSAVDRARYMKVHLLLPWLALTVVSLVPATLVHWGFVLAPLAAALPLAGIAHLNWKRHGYAVAGEYGFIRDGFIGTQYTLFPLFKVQRVDIRQTPLQHRKGLAHLVIHLASHTLKVPYIPLVDALTIRDLALYQAESTDRPWY